MATAQTSTSVGSGKECTKKHVLLVDDDPSFRSYASMLLTKNGYRVSQACDGWEALRSVNKMQSNADRIDLLFTDLRMQTMSGMELIRKVRALGLNMPVLVATGFLDDVIFDDLQQINGHRFLSKPFKPQELLRHVDELTVDNPVEEA